MAMVLEAAVVSFGALDHGVEHVGWSVDETGEGGHFIVERCFSDDADPDGGYCLVVGPATYYGGVISAEVEDGSTSIVLTDEAAAALGIDSELSFQYPTHAVNRSGLQAQLARILAD